MDTEESLPNRYSAL